MTVYNKLVRDNIPEYPQKKNIPFKIYIADELEYWEKLKEKLLEEINEFYLDESIGEMADIIEVLETIKKYKEFSNDDIEKEKSRKFLDRGGFEKRIILDES